MASITPRSGKFQLRVKHRLLPKPFFFTFDTYDRASTYGQQLEALLARGIVPQDLLEPPEPGRKADPRLSVVIGEYLNLAPVAETDVPLLQLIRGEVGEARVSDVTVRWAEDYVRQLKAEKNLAPGSIRKRVGSLGRVVDWHINRTTEKNETRPPNALRLLPRGYSAYNQQDAENLPADATPKTDISRDHRLEPETEAAVRRALAGEKRPDRERPWPADPGFPVLFDLIINTGMRLSECFRLRVGQLDLQGRVIHVEGSKGHRGKLKPRTVPMGSKLASQLRDWCAGRTGLVFDYWDGTVDDKRRCSARLSARFATLFDYAGAPHLTEHDLRHEATCRWFELRRPAGGWTFNEVEICKIMGWTDTRMALRYASLRGSDLSARMD